MEKKSIEPKDSSVFQIEENWEVHSKILKEQFAELTDDDVKLTSGNEIQLLEKLEKKLNKTREEIINIIRIGVS